MLVVSELCNDGLKVRIVPPIDPRGKLSPQRHFVIGAVLIVLHPCVAKKSFMGVGVVVNGDEVRRLRRSSADDRPGCQGVMVGFDHIDVLALDDEMLEFATQCHGSP